MSNQHEQDLEQAFKAVDMVTAEVKRSIELSHEDLLIVTGGLVVGESVIFEGDPGTGKTALSKSLATAIGGDYGRVQGTPDVMASDITGSPIYNPATRGFEFIPGPIFKNVTLIDEMNRMSTKAQSAVFEGMEEKQVTVNGKTYDLVKPSLTLATHNPNAYGQGVNPIPEAALDRFGIGIEIKPHDASKMVSVDNLVSKQHEPNQAINNIAQIEAAKNAISGITVPDEMKVEIAKLIVAVREHDAIDPETTVLSGQRPFNVIKKLAQLRALAGEEKIRRSVAERDIANVAKYVLSHRIGLTNAAQKSTTKQEVIDEVLVARGL